MTMHLERHLWLFSRRDMLSHWILGSWFSSKGIPVALLANYNKCMKIMSSSNRIFLSSS